MSEPVEIITAVHRLVETKTFLSGAGKHTKGLASYVRDFLVENGGLPNEYGRKWTFQMCAEQLDIPAPTLRRWVKKLPPLPGDADLLVTDDTPSDQQESAPYTDDGVTQEPAVTENQRVKRSVAKSELADPDERKAVLEALPAEVRDEVRGDLMELDSPSTTWCRHCAHHCPSK